MRKLDSALHEKLLSLINSMGCEFVGGELMPQGGQMILRIYIDGEKGVTLDDCSRVSHQLSAMFDVEGPVQGRYILEVSSPGIDRPLFTLAHYQKHVGQEVKLKLHLPINQRRQYKGVLQQVTGADIHLLVEGIPQAVVVPFSAIDKGNLVTPVSVKSDGRIRKTKN